jgi:hypothetical protein
MIINLKMQQNIVRTMQKIWKIKIRMRYILKEKIWFFIYFKLSGDFSAISIIFILNANHLNKFSC